MSLTCGLCEEKYDLDQHMPKRPSCSHTICLACYMIIELKSGIFTCPLCQTVDNRDAKDVENDENLRIHINRTIIPCSRCNKKSSDSINLESFDTYCKNCVNIEQSSAFIESSIYNKLTQLYFTYKKAFSFEFKNYIKQTLKKKNSLKLELIHLMKLYISNQKHCSVHPNEHFKMLKLFWFKPSCRSCLDIEFDKIEVTIESIYPTFCDLVMQNLRERNNFIVYGSVVKFFNSFPENFWSAIVETYLMTNRYLESVSLMSCMFCRKGFCLGSRMPYKMKCGHLICRTCIDYNPDCYWCKCPSPSYEIFIHKSLYNLPKCINCTSTKTLGYTNLPFHYFCDCIICSECSTNLFFCSTCVSSTDITTGHKLKVSKRALRTINYLKVTLKCWNCCQNPSAYLSFTYKMVLCEACSINDANKQKLVSDESLDLSLIELYGNYFKTNYPKLYFESLSLNQKLYQISYICSGRVNNDGSYSHLNLRELDRFSSFYPVNNNDPRGLKIQENQTFFVEFQVTQCIKVCGFKVAGSASGKNIKVRLDLANSQNNLIGSECVEFKSKVGYIMLKHALEINYYRVLVTYLQAGVIFTGKPRNSNEIEKDQVKFSFMDPTNKGGEYCGPIVGVIYALD